ncbi:VanZ family protein [Paenibacillus sp. 32O-W]|jgi:hypothetical protein|uniref:VanZ-like domain-containing protein n=1 Tax=Paenibacillus cisolokensis TaxID=1658519 RepID=A0ABQ4MZX1_9BACL|nr:MULTISPECIES: VanZ family protein [Paenibacillus]ALS27428.1 VanZ family protein [Paenibacillus sp. 32O-W]GIQ61466.1 hypothetical protein PACILC2_00340 [Paenibacillus cisolokensis]
MKQTDQRQTGRFRRLWRWLPAVAWMAVIFVLSGREGDELNTVLPLFQQWMPWMESFDWGHYFAYFILALAFDFALGGRADRWSGKLLIVALCGLYGVTDEYHQSFVDGRTPDVLDLRNDCIGAAMAVALTAIPFIRKRWRRIAP